MNIAPPFKLINTDVFTHVLSVIRQMQTDFDADKPLMEIVIREYKGTRSIEANALLHVWVDEVSKKASNEWAGHSPKWWKRYYKYKFLMPIYKRDNKDGGEYTAKMMILETVLENGTGGEQLTAQRIMADTTRSSQASVKQMYEFLKSIQNDAPRKGVVLTTPNDMEWLQ